MLATSWMRVLLILLCQCYLTEAMAQTTVDFPTKPFFDSFGMQELNSASDNLSITHDNENRIVLASYKNLQLFDGVGWRQFTDAQPVFARFLKFWGNRLYAGDLNALGYYEPDSAGIWRYHDLLPMLPEDKQEIGQVWEGGLRDNTLYMTTDFGYVEITPDNTVTAYEKSHVVTGDSGDYFWLGFDDKLTVYSPADSGLPNPLNVTVPFGTDTWINGVLPVSDGLWVITSSKGIFHYRDGRFERLSLPQLDSMMVVSSVVVPGGIAIGTVSNGIFVFNESGTTIEHFPTQGTVVHTLDYVDDILWVGTQNTVLRIPWPAAIAPVSADKETFGQPGALALVENQLYLGASAGLFAWQPESESFEPTETGTPSSVWAMRNTPAGLLVQFERGAEVISGDQRYTLLNSESRVSVPLKNWPDYYFIPFINGKMLIVDLGATGPRVISEIDIGNQFQVNTAATDKRGNIYLSGIKGELFSVNINEEFQMALTAFDAKVINDRDPFAEIQLNNIDGEVFAITSSVVCRLVRQTQNITCEEDDKFNGQFAGTLQIKQVSKDAYLFDLLNATVLVTRQQDGRWMKQPSLWQMLRNNAFLDALTLENGIVLAARLDGVWRVDLNTLVPRAQPQAFVQAVTNDGVPVFNRLGVGQEIALSLPVEQNSFRIAFGTSAMGVAEKFRWRSRVVGLEEQFTPWTQENWRDFTQLSGGDYAIEVQVKDAANIHSAVSSMSFSIAYPWYLTPLVKVIWILLLLVIIGLFSGWLSHYRTARLREQKTALEQAVKERTAQLNRQTEQLKEQAHQLTLLDEAKSRFFANITHEFRTPLTLTIGPVQDILSGRFGPVNDAVAQALTLAHSRSQQLLQLVEEMLDIARLDAGALPLYGQNIRVSGLVTEIIAQLDSMAEAKDITLTASNNGEETDIVADRKQLSKVLVNLIGNAIKFTPEGGRVAVVVNENETEIALSVTDTGPGLTSDQIAQIFDRFKQVDTDKHKTLGGVGLGLSLAKEIAEMHSGTIEVRSEPGAGATFILHLPKYNSLEVSETPTNEKAAMEANATLLVEADRDKTQNGELPLILVIEDDKDLQRYIAGHLSEHYRVEVSNNGEAGLLKARALTPDLIISDVMMPVMGGMELCQHLKADAETDFIPVILLTARVDDKDRISGYEHGADDYLTKPFDATVLLSRVANLLIASGRWRARLEKAGLQLAVTPGLQDKDKRFADTFTAMLTARMPDSEFNVEQMATAMNMERTTLYKRVQLVFGKTPSELLINSRLNAAAQLLAENKGSVSEIAYAVGYNSVAHFTQSFKKQFKQTPSAYRRESQN